MAIEKEKKRTIGQITSNEISALLTSPPVWASVGGLGFSGGGLVREWRDLEVGQVTRIFIWPLEVHSERVPKLFNIFGHLWFIRHTSQVGRAPNEGHMCKRIQFFFVKIFATNKFCAEIFANFFC